MTACGPSGVPTRGKVNGGLSRYRVAKTKALAEGPSPSPWRDQAGKEREEQRELAQRLALAAPIAAPAPETPTAPEPRRPWWRRVVG